MKNLIKLFIIQISSFNILYSPKRYLFVILATIYIIPYSIKGQKVNLDSGLVACYPFSGNANDESGNGNNGTVYGASLTTDRFGNPNCAYEFEGDSQYISLPSTIKFVKDMTISIWLKTKSIDYNSWPYSTALIFRDMQDSPRDWSICFGNGGKIQFETGGDSTGDHALISKSNINNDKWVHIVIIKDAEHKLKEIFINGIKDTIVSTAQDDKFDDFENNYLNISLSVLWSFSLSYYHGIMDDIRFYNRALNVNEIQTLYNGNPNCKGYPFVSMASSNSPVCERDTLKLFASAISGATYNWIGPDSFTSNQQNPFITNVTTAASGTYNVTATVNDTTSLPDSIYVNINAPVEINPVFYNASQMIDSNVAFTLSPTSGSSPFSYQWLLDGKIISNATNSLYSKANVSMRDSGTYSCIISNICGSVTGKVVYLEVINSGRTHHEITGYVTYDNKAKTPLSSKFDSTATNVYLFNSGDTLIAGVKTDDNGYYEFVNIINGTHYISGSTKKAWGGSNPTDALIVNRNYIGLYNFTDSLLKHAGDVDSNGHLDPTDALIINRRYIGLLTKYPKVGNWKFQKIKLEMAGVNLKQNILAVCSGDVNASYAPYLIPGKLIYTPINTIGTLNINPNPNPNLSPSPIDIPVYLNDNITLGAIGTKFRIQNSKFKILNVHSEIPGLLFNIQHSTFNIDEVNIAWSATDEGIDVTPDNPLFYIKAIYNGEPNSSSFQLPASNFQFPASSFRLSSESELTDININPISIDKLFIPKLQIIQNLEFRIQNFPNPFTSITNIVYTISEDLNVKLNIYNVLGERVITLVNTIQPAGQYTIKYDASNLRQGIYYCKIEATNSTSSFSKTNIMMIAR